MVFAQRVEVPPRLRRNNVVMSVKVENAFSSSIACNQTNGVVAGAFFRLASFHSLAFESDLPQSVFEQIRASTIILPRRVLRGYGNQLGHQPRPPARPLPHARPKRTRPARPPP